MEKNRCITGLMNVKMYITSNNRNMEDGGRWMNMVESGVLLIRTVKAFAKGLQECPRIFFEG